jgi:Ca2+-binding RTX toxin-like protein
MPTFYGTTQNEFFMLGHYTSDVTVFADGSGMGVPTLDVDSFNVIMSGRGNDNLYGGYGRDVIFGGAGNDTISGSGGGYAGSPSGTDSIASRDGADYLDGGNGNDTIRGNGGADTILGGNGNDVIYGGGGRNTVYGGNGDDIITSTGDVWGGNGRDTFLYSYGGPSQGQVSAFPTGNAADGTVDTIHDFHSGQDKIDLHALGVSADELQVVNTVEGIELHFLALFLPGQIDLAGTHHVTNSDFIFAA